MGHDTYHLFHVCNTGSARPMFTYWAIAVRSWRVCRLAVTVLLMIRWALCGTSRTNHSQILHGRQHLGIWGLHYFLCSLCLWPRICTTRIFLLCEACANSRTRGRMPGYLYVKGKINLGCGILILLLQCIIHYLHYLPLSVGFCAELCHHGCYSIHRRRRIISQYQPRRRLYLRSIPDREREVMAHAM